MAINDVVKEHKKNYIKDGTVKEVKKIRITDRITSGVNIGTLAYALSLIGVKQMSETVPYFRNGIVRWLMENLNSTLSSKIELLQNVSSYKDDLMKGLPYVLGAFLVGNALGGFYKNRQLKRIEKRHIDTLASLTGSRKYKGCRRY